MRQYRSIKGEHKDAVLFFRLGDFYEMFEHDAKEVSKILNITLTTRHGIPMCGIPYHAASSYIPRLLKAGRKIAICEQTLLPKGGKGIAERQVVEIITPGTVIEEDYLDSKSNNYLLSLGGTAKTGSISFIDVSTGDFQCTSFPWDRVNEVLRKELWRIQPSEIIIQESLYDENQTVRRILEERKRVTVNRIPDWQYDIENAYKGLTGLFGTQSLKGFGINENDPAIFSAGVLLEYLNETAKAVLPHIRSIRPYTDTQYLGLDESTQRNLELVRNLQDGSSQFSLLDVLDHTRTPMGGRVIRTWILRPLLSKREIDLRLDAVGRFYHNQILLNRLRELLSSVQDIERLSARIGMDKAHGKDLLSLLNSLSAIDQIINVFSGWEDRIDAGDPGKDSRNGITELIVKLENAVHEDPSVVLTEGRLIRRGFSEELDGLRNLRENSKAVLDEYLKEEKEHTGIQNLKIKYNKIIGYFFDVSKGNLSLVPGNFIRRQTLVNGERFTTDTLIELEAKMNSASEKALDVEKKLFIEFRDSLKSEIPLIQDLGEYIGKLDVLSSFAHSATLYGYTRPEVHENTELKIVEGRHPVVEKNLPPGDFIPNTLEIGAKVKRFALITGPNMAGKSTFLRQNALITLMAQIGSYVPAGEATIGIVDRIFCRVGASDNLARGESTFLVEMNETANILNSATEKSLVIMDEVGRGTSTNDGLSIAWAVCEYLAKLKSRTLFATHYHELTQLKTKGLFNLSLEVLENEGEIVFLKRIKEGPSGNSYGIHVAKLAGIPGEVLSRAGNILAELTKREKELPESGGDAVRSGDTVQNELFEISEIIIDEMRSLQIDACTPIDALNMIARWKKELRRKS